MTMLLMTAMTVLTVMAGTYGQPIIDDPTVVSTSQPIDTDNLVNPSTTTSLTQPFNESSANGLKKVRKSINR